MTKKCECLPRAKAVVDEIRAIYEHSEPEDMKENADFISGMLFVVQEAGLADTLPEFVDISDSIREKNIDKFRDAAYSAANKIEKIKC